jgi:(1->4)-alpha-D-glucan 1-alpha-D-glucosylmutase
MHTLLAAEISGLASRLDRLAQQHLNTTDFTLFDLRAAIVEVAACFPVYRTYMRGDGKPSADDVRHVRQAVGMALGHKQAPRRALEFLERVLLDEAGDEGARRAAAREFTLKFQQVTAPAMAKGVEDTAYYRYPALLASTEVGGDPTSHGIGTDALHAANAARQREYPRCVLATSTHDTKRGEDARWRLAALTELHSVWAECLARWRKLRGRRRSARSVGASMEYLLLQSLLAVWPVAPAVDAGPGLRQRLEDYAIKAAREAKEHTSWLDPDEEYEQSLRAFVALLLPEDPDAGFHAYFRNLIEPVAFFGMLNALSATVLKLTSPGIPDIYQGNELPQLVLVDPDNRRQPDYAAHAQLLDAIARNAESPTAAAAAAAMLVDWRDGRLKLFTCSRLLGLRRAWPELFDSGDYTPMPVKGPRAAHLCAFTRTAGDSSLVVVVSRWAATLSRGQIQPPLGEASWRDNQLELPATVPAGDYVDALTGRAQRLHGGAARMLDVASLLETLPVTVLVRTGSARTAAASAP